MYSLFDARAAQLDNAVAPVTSAHCPNEPPLLTLSRTAQRHRRTQGRTPEEVCPEMSHNVSPERTIALSPRQAAALPYVASESTITRGAQAAQITRRTLTRWMNEPAFRDELERIRNNIADFAFSQLEGLALKGTVRIEQLMDSDDPNVAHRASKTALSMSLSVRDQRETRRRMDTLENAITLIRQQR